MSTKKRYFARQGQAFLIVVIIVATVVSIFTISVSNSIRSSVLEGTEIYQREQALYVAEYGINQMIYNINNGTTYTNGQSITGNTISNVGNYKATYITPDSSGFGGSAVIKGEGTVGTYKRVIYASLQAGSDAYKYCMFTGAGGNGGLSTGNFTNSTYGSSYFYNTNTTTIPDVNLATYANDYGYTYLSQNSNYIYTPTNNAKVYIHYSGTNPSATLTLNFNNSYACSIITDFPNVSVTYSSGTTWSYVGTAQQQYPLIVHKSLYSTSSTFNIETSLGYQTFTMTGILYTNATFGVNYSWLLGDSYLINGMLIAGKADNLAPGGLLGSFDIVYKYDYYTYVPVGFPAVNVTKFLTPSFREEY